MHFLSSHYRDEFLAVPALVRFTIAQGANGSEVTLLIKAISLSLKYLLRLRNIRLFFVRTKEGYLAYGIQIDDDPDHPATIWSIVEHIVELQALQTLSSQPKCFVFLYNELAVNVAWAEIDIDLSHEAFVQLVSNTQIHPPSELEAATEIGDLFDALHRRELEDGRGKATERFVVPEWHRIQSHYITNRTSNSLISIHEENEGAQQEAAALWLIDTLSPTGAIQNPQIHEPNKIRELSA